MTKDLEETLAELGEGYREVVDRLNAAYATERHAVVPVSSTSVSRFFPGRATGWSIAYLVAASLLVFIGLGVVFLPSQSGRRALGRPDNRFVLAYSADDFARSAIVASQRADGSWANDFLTRQNAAALRGASAPAERIAYKKAVRYLRSHGLEPLTDEELRARGDYAASRTLHS